MWRNKLAAFFTFHFLNWESFPDEKQNVFDNKQKSSCSVYLFRFFLSPDFNKCDYAWNWKLLQTLNNWPTWTSYMNVIIINKKSLWEKNGPLAVNKLRLKLMLSSRPEHVRRRADETQEITVQLHHVLFGMLPLLPFFPPLHLSFSFLSLNTSPVPSYPISVLNKRKLEMQEHIVTVGCFHLHSHLWHGHTWATLASQPKCGKKKSANK